jgi:hypothetical protein
MSVDNQLKKQQQPVDLLSTNITLNNQNKANSSSLSSVSSISPKNIAANNLKVIQLNMQQKNSNNNCTTNGSITSSGSSSTNSSTYVKNKSGGASQLAKQHQHQMVLHDGMDLADLDVQKLPASIKFELDQLELELLEGDITQKGYDKKRSRLLETYLKSLSLSNDQSCSSNAQSNSDCKETSDSIRIKEKIRVYRKKNKDEANSNSNRYHSGWFNETFIC